MYRNDANHGRLKTDSHQPLTKTERIHHTHDGRKRRRRKRRRRSNSHKKKKKNHIYGTMNR
jgi:hypothetical protein